jgi:hypothetical protein
MKVRSILPDSIAGDHWFAEVTDDTPQLRSESGMIPMNPRGYCHARQAGHWAQVVYRPGPNTGEVVVGNFIPTLRLASDMATDYNHKGTVPA